MNPREDKHLKEAFRYKPACQFRFAPATHPQGARDRERGAPGDAAERVQMQRMHLCCQLSTERRAVQETASGI